MFIRIKLKMEHNCIEMKGNLYMLFVNQNIDWLAFFNFSERLVYIVSAKITDIAAVALTMCNGYSGTLCIINFIIYYKKGRMQETLIYVIFIYYHY